MSSDVQRPRATVSTETEPIDVLGYRVSVTKEPSAKVWNDIKTARPGETAFAADTRMLQAVIEDWDILPGGVDPVEGLPAAALEDDLSPVIREALVYKVTEYYLQLEVAHSEILRAIYPKKGDGSTDPQAARGAAPASASGRPSTSRPTRSRTGRSPGSGSASTNS